MYANERGGSLDSLLVTGRQTKEVSRSAPLGVVKVIELMNQDDRQKTREDKSDVDGVGI